MQICYTAGCVKSRMIGIGSDILFVSLPNESFSNETIVVNGKILAYCLLFICGFIAALLFSIEHSLLTAVT